MSELFEEFEFKPLTEGLGFHKPAERAANFAEPEKAAFADLSKVAARVSTERATASATERALDRTESMSTAIPRSYDFEKEAYDSLPSRTWFTNSSAGSEAAPELKSTQAATFTTATSTSAAPSFESSFPQMFQPLARNDFDTSAAAAEALANLASAPIKSAAKPAAFTTDFPEPGTRAGSTEFSASASTSLRGSGLSVGRSRKESFRARFEESFVRSFPHAEKMIAEQAQDLVPVQAGITSAVLDGFVVSGLSTILLVCILAITKINLVALLTSAATDVVTSVNLALLFVAVLQMYMLVARAFFGATLGEWAFDLQLGRKEDQARIAFPFRVALRTMLMTVTGLAFLPLISLLLRRDLGRDVSGLQLYRRS